MGETVADSTDAGTSRPNLPIIEKEGTFFTPVPVLPILCEVRLPEGVLPNDAVALWNFFFSPE